MLRLVLFLVFESSRLRKLVNVNGNYELPTTTLARHPGKEKRRTQDIVDWNVDELDKEADKAHDEEAKGGRLGDSHKLLHVWLLASLDELRALAGILLRQGRQILELVTHAG